MDQKAKIIGFVDSVSVVDSLGNNPTAEVFNDSCNAFAGYVYSMLHNKT